MNMIRTGAVATTDICYAQLAIRYNKYLPQFSVCNNNLIYDHISLLLPIVGALLCGWI
jgi:hypothetical protein